MIMNFFHTPVGLLHYKKANKATGGRRMKSEIHDISMKELTMDVSFFFLFQMHKI